MKEIVIKQAEKTFKATENLLGESRVFEVFNHRQIRPKLPQIRRVFEVDIENPFKTENRGFKQEPFDPDDHREVFLQ